VTTVGVKFHIDENKTGKHMPF